MAATGTSNSFLLAGQFGTATMSYFRFLRWMMFLNLFMTIFMISIVFLPFVLIQPASDFESSVDECNSTFHYRAFILSSNYSDNIRSESSSESASQLVLDVLQGTVSVQYDALTHSHTMTPFDAPGKQAF